MRMTMFLIAAATVASGCSRGGGSSNPAPRNSDVVVVNDKASGSNDARVRHVPRGHYPPPGMCRIWMPGTPPGHQPKPAPCNTLGKVPSGAFVLYNNRASDAKDKSPKASASKASASKASESKASASKASESKASASKASPSKANKSKAGAPADSTSKTNGKKPK